MLLYSIIGVFGLWICAVRRGYSDESEYDSCTENCHC